MKRKKTIRYISHQAFRRWRAWGVGELLELLVKNPKGLTLEEIRGAGIPLNPYRIRVLLDRGIISTAPRGLKLRLGPRWLRVMTRIEG